MTMSRADLAAIADELEAAVDARAAAAYRPRYNIAPTDRHLMLVGDRDIGPTDPSLMRVGAAAGATAGTGAQTDVSRVRTRRLVSARWGFGRDRLLINARSETVATRPAFRDAFARHRCVIPADGFYEWTGPKGHRRPIWFHRADERLLLMAGIWETTADGPCFTVLTTTPNAAVAPIHDRMPVLLAPEDVSPWLAAPEARLLRPAPDTWLVAQPASLRVNSVENDDPGCLVADPAPDVAAPDVAAPDVATPDRSTPDRSTPTSSASAPRQLSLFGR